MNSTPETATSAHPLCVDLDGTLVLTDTLWESFFLLIRQKPLALFGTLIWLARGRAAVKQEIARRVTLDPSVLPYCNEVIQCVREARARGTRTLLVTAADHRIARTIADHLGIFDEIIASDGSVNLKGTNKLKALCERFGERQFDYIGDSTADLAIWNACASAYVCGGARMAERAHAVCEPKRIFSRSGIGIKPLIFALRPHQWAKNLLLVLPLILAHQANVEHIDKVIAVCLAFVSFCLCASAAYVLNDLLDLTNDRQHRSKRHRPFASGALPIHTGPVLFGLLAGASFVLAVASLPWAFVGMLAIYFVTTLFYSLYLKQKMLLDVMFLAGLYTLRILAGSAAADVPLSPWMLAFSMFFFLSLALAKRYGEVMTLESGDIAYGRNYAASDMNILQNAGLASGYMSVLVLALYINSDVVVRLYDHPQVLWLLCPVLLYWVTRLWFFAHRGKLHDDPVVFAMTDRVSWLTGALSAVLVLLAAW